MAFNKRPLLLLLLALIAASCLVRSAAARRQLRDTGDVKSKTTVSFDLNGGVAPLADRLEAAAKLNDKKAQLLLAEAKCKHNGDLKCKEVVKIKKEIAAAAKKPKPKVEAPCYQNIFWSYFLGTVCDLPPDSKKDGNDRPAPKKKE